MSNKFVGSSNEVELLSSCAICKHKNIGNSTCTAYPNGIPERILSGEFDHKKPYKGDNGIQFEPIKPKKSTENDNA